MKIKLLSYILAICMMFGFVQPVFATEKAEQNLPSNEKVYASNIAYVNNVNKNGTNIYDEIIDGSSKTIPNTNAIIKTFSDNELEITADINGAEVIFSGIPIARTESGKTLFFDGTSNNTSYEIVAFSYILDTSTTNMYFKNTKSTKYPTSDTMLKLYVRDISTETRDYYLIEIFDVNLNYDNQYIQSLPINPLLGAWVATEFEPIEEDFGEDTNEVAPAATSSTKYWYCTKSYYNMGENQTHTIKWRTNVDYSNIVKGQEANQYYRLTVYAKSMSFDVNTDLNSNTMSYLHVDGLRLCQTSIPYTAWKSTSIDGEVQNNGLKGELSASIGVSYGLLSVSYSIPISFSAKGTVDINETYTGYENGVNGNYTRSIETEMDSNYKLTQNGYYFEVVSMLRDYGNAARSSQTLKATWYVDIINASTMEICSHTCSHNVSVSITE